jgi:recombination protein RecA
MREFRLGTFRGRLVEVSGGSACAGLTLVFRLVLEAQRAGEPVAWLNRNGSAFFPPDVAQTGIDLSALAVIWTDDLVRMARSTDHLVRSGAFGLVVLDLGSEPDVPRAFQMRLAGLARKHATALICLTEKGARQPSLGTLVSLRAEAVRERGPDGRFHCEARILKDKRRGPGWKHVEVCHAPDGLR